MNKANGEGTPLVVLEKKRTVRFNVYKTVGTAVVLFFFLWWVGSVIY